MSTQAHNLVGETIPGGWTICQKVLKAANDTGGYFSVQYYCCPVKVI